MKKLRLFIMPLILIMPFVSGCGKNKQLYQEWYQDSNFINSLTLNDIGLEKEVAVNGVAHKVRLIGIDHDDLSDGSGKAHTTWEFANLISDKNGYSLATPWYWEEEGLYSRSLYYINYSNLRKAMDGGGNARAIEWYEKDGTEKSTTYTTPVLNMLPSNLQVVLKEVKKPVAEWNDGGFGFIVNENDYITKLFPLSRREITDAPPDEFDGPDEGNTYEFYKGDTANNRIKHQVAWHDGALSNPPYISIERENEGVIDRWEANSYAGYNSNLKDEYGSYQWLRSPSMFMAQSNFFSAVCLTFDGLFAHANLVAQNLMNVAPAFCI